MPDGRTIVWNSRELSITFVAWVKPNVLYISILYFQMLGLMPGYQFILSWAQSLLVMYHALST